ncbi:MAG TPA: hypothetical protein VG269_09605 [Tepidisphaeraceae bacterium]|jgi:hypothetical protein|nr:hypothetical protein [Tepidisphaeraceae bacterium]
MKADFINEPELEFGRGGRHIDVRFGLSHFGPLDAGGTARQAIRVGVIGDDATNDLFHEWLARCRGGIEAKQSTLPTLFPRFNGFGDGGAFCDFVSDAHWTRAIPSGDLEELSRIEPTQLMIDRVIARYLEEAKDLASKSPDVIVCILSPKLLKRIDVQSAERRGPRSRRKSAVANAPEKIHLHDLLKARGMSIGRPLQVTRPGTLGGDVQRYRLDGTASLDMQDEATRAWNFFCALYYKAGGTPWRLVRESTELATCYVGVSFFEAGDGSSLQTSVAQVFNERGEGVVVRGGPATISKEDRTPHLEREDAAKLLVKALTIYRREHRTMPARMVCHKSSYFTDDEIAGFRDAAKQERIDAVDLVSIRKSMTRLYRQGAYPPLRGTCLELDDSESLLYTNGSVDFYRCYPGLYVPRALSVEWDDAHQAPRKLLREILALTKMNWNTTTFANSEPITIGAARVVGDIMRHIREGEPLQEGYSYYM